MISILINKVLAVQSAGTGANGGIGVGSGAGGINNPLGFDDLTSLLVFIGGKLFILSIPIVTVMILYGAFQILTAAGEPAKIEIGKKTIWYAIIGFGVVLIAGGISDLINNFMTTP
jgi:hypothetical protein